MTGHALPGGPRPTSKPGQVEAIEPSTTDEWREAILSTLEDHT